MKTLNLCLHAGAQQVDREVLSTSRTPEATESWTPIPHFELIDQVERALGGQNLRVVNEAHALGRDGQRYFGLLQVANCIDTEEYSYVVGLRNSHDKSFPAGLVVGSQVFVCDNLAFSGEIKIARRHTTFIRRDLPGLTARAVGQLADKWMDEGKKIEAMKSTELNNERAHHLLIKALDCRAIVATDVPKVLREFRAPKHPEFAADMNVWRFFNAVTEVNKGCGIFNLPRRTQALYGLLHSEMTILN